MTQRMSKEQRRGQLLGITRTMFSQAKGLSDFTAKKIAEEAKVSEVWVYRLVGEEFSALRQILGNADKTSATKEQKLLRENHRLRHERDELRRSLSELKSEHTAELQGDYAEAIKVIEAQDEEIRGLRGLIALYEKRLTPAVPTSLLEQFNDLGSGGEFNN